MARTRVVMNQAGYDSYRNSPEMVAALEDVGSSIQARAQVNVDTAFRRPFLSDGEDISMETIHDPSRAVTFIATATLKGRTAEHTHRALNRAVLG